MNRGRVALLFGAALAVAAWDSAAAANPPANGSCWTEEEAKNEVNTAFLGLMAQHIVDPNVARGLPPRRLSCPIVPAFGAYPICSNPEAVRAAYNNQAASENCIANSAVDPSFSPVRGKAAFDMGEKYYYGRGVARDYVAAYGWYVKAGNYPGAKTSIAYLYEEGLGVSQNYQRSLSYYGEAAAAGDAGAQRQIGYMYSTGEGTPVNYAQAMAWFRKAAANGDGLAIFDVGSLYDNGNGVQENSAEAFRWFIRAAKADDPHGMKALCTAYGSGRGVERNLRTALYWCQKTVARARQTGDDDILDSASKAIDEINSGGSGYSYSAPSAPSNPYAITQDPRFNPSGH
jgi:hypothetical protein